MKIARCGEIEVISRCVMLPVRSQNCPAVLNMITFGQFYLFSFYDVLNVIYYTAQVTSGNVSRYYNSYRATFSLLMVLGPVVDVISAILLNGILRPLASTIRFLYPFGCFTAYRRFTFRVRSNERFFLVHLETTSPASMTFTIFAKSVKVMPYFAITSLLGSIFNCGRSTCCSTFRSAILQCPECLLLFGLPMENILLRSVPNNLIAIDGTCTG
jgi:hypothetical protein